MGRTHEVESLTRIGELARRGEITTVAQILTGDPMPLVRRRAMEVLLESKMPLSYELLADAASGPEMGLNDEILNALKDRPGEVALRALARALSSENSLRRATAAVLISQRPEPLALTLLLRAARDPMKSVARIAERAMVLRVEKNPETLSSIPRETISGIIAFTPLKLAQQLVTSDYPVNVRAEAVKRLAVLSGVEAVATLVAFSSDPDPVLARAGWDGLKGIGSLPSAFLLPYLGDRRDEFRKQGLELFVRGCGTEGASIVLGFLKDKSPAIREVAIRALYQIQKDDAVPAIRKLADDPDLSVRRAVLGAFSKAQGADLDLKKIAIETNDPLHDNALIALASHRFFDQDLATHYLEFLDRFALEQTQSPAVVDAMAAIAKILGDAQEPRAISGFAALCRTTSRRLRRTGIEAILLYPVEQRGDILLSLADTHDRNMLASIALALANANDPRATIPLIRVYIECSGRNALEAGEKLQSDPKVSDVEFLVELLSNKWASARRYSAGKLKNSSDPRVVDPLLKASEDEDTEVQLAAIEALSGFAAEVARVAERLIAACAQGDVTVRQAAVEALGTAKVEAAVPNLIKALHSVFLRPRAEEALRKIGGRQGYLAMKRLRRREELFGKKNKRRKEKKRMPA